jgi:putative ABC transport system substrate-binding protein
LTSLAEYGDRVEAVRTGLRRLGYEESKNIVIHYRWADGRYDRLPELAAELVQLNVDVIVTHSTPGSGGQACHRYYPNRGQFRRSR